MDTHKGDIMRFIIEANNKDAEVKIREFVDQQLDSGIIDEYEPIERLSARVEKMRLAFEEFKENKGNMRILNYYLRGRGINQSEIDTVISGIEEFLKQLE